MPVCIRFLLKCLWKAGLVLGHVGSKVRLLTFPAQDELHKLYSAALQKMDSNRQACMIICGNWKGNCNRATFKMASRFSKSDFSGVEVAVAVPHIYISRAKKAFPEFVRIAAQDISKYGPGAYTGEINGRMLQERGVSYVILGHSERRTLFSETSEDVSIKVSKSLEYNLKPIICIGEPIVHRKSKTYLEYLHNQLKKSLGSCTNTAVDIAYEPIWAIGSGRSATRTEIAEVADNLRGWMEELGLCGRILYGGSVNECNAREIVGIASVDGLLVGNSALTDEFERIAKIMSNTQ